MPVFPASDFDPAQLPEAMMSPPEMGEDAEFPPSALVPTFPVAAPSDPQMAELFAMMEAGGDEDILTDEEREQINALINIPNNSDFDRNLAAEMDESDLDFLAQQVCDRFDWDEQSRKDWYNREAEGIRLLGVSTNVEGGADFEGAADVVHPMMTEAVLQFHARALSEMWPPDGPAKTIVLGQITPEREMQAKRVQDYMNYAYTTQMRDAFNITDKLLFRLPLSGSAFIKLYYCPLRGQVVRQLVKPGDFVVPYHCDDLDTAPRTTHVLRMTHLDVRKLQKSGFYLDFDLNEPSDEDALTDRTLRNEIDATDSRFESTTDEADQRHVILEQTCFLNLPGIDPEDGLESPYIVHVDKEQQKVLAIYRNWKEGDPLRNPRRYVIHYQFLPGLGFYGYGLYHIMSGLARAATGSLRALLDAAYFANLPAGYRSRDARIRGKDTTLSPGEWKEVEATTEQLSKSFFPLPYKEPSAVLFNLLGLLDQLGRRLGGAVEVLVGDANSNGPVGTTLALIEQGLKVMSGIHMRLHRAQTEELTLFAELSSEYLPEGGYPYAIAGADQQIFAEDFDERIDVIPTSDPNVPSATHRLATAQALLDLSKQAPDLYNVREVHKRMLTAMRVQDPEQILPPEQEPPRADPVTEGTALLTGKPVKAFQDQDHQAHIVVHMDLLERVPMFIGAAGSKQRAQTQTAIMAHISEHAALQTALMYQQAIGQQLPQGQQIPPEIENQIAMMAAQAAQLLPKPENPDPQEAQAAQQAQLAEATRMKAEMDAEKTRAELRRKDTLAAADMERKNAALAAEINRKAATQEADLLEKFISTQAKLALQKNPNTSLPPVSG
jgi:hypothetical protein